MFETMSDNGSPLKMMKNAFYFTLKAFFVLEIFKGLFWLFGHVGKQLYYKAKVSFRIYYRPAKI